MIGYAFTGSYCTFKDSYKALLELIRAGYEVQPIMSENAYSQDSRFQSAMEFREKVRALCGRSIIHTIGDAEPLGPSKRLDALIISPCTGNTLAKLANGITDTAVTMAAKAHLRSDGKLMLAVASNDAASQNLKNIAALMMHRSVFFLPMRQDDPTHKPHSLVADFSLMKDAVKAMEDNAQLRPVFI